MPEFKPFRGIRPGREIAGGFSTKGVDKYSREELEKELENNPESFLHIINPIWTSERINIQERHKRVRQNFLDFANGSQAERDKPSYYIYQIIDPDEKSVRAIIGLVNMHEYKAGKIKTHENTLTKRVKRFADYLLDVHFHAEPVLLTYKQNQRVDLLMDVEMKRLPMVSFKDKKGNEHQLWQIENRLNMIQIKDSIERNEVFYIADGHHRMESSMIYTERMNEILKDDTFDDDTINYTLAMLVSDKDLIIKDYNRLIKDLNGLTTEEFLEKIAETFSMAERGETPFFPSKKHHMGLYIDGKFYSLFVKKEALTVEGMSELDTYLFEELVAKPLLNIQDSKDDNRIGFLRGTGDIQGVINLQKKVDSGKYKAGFFMYPVVSDDLEKIADLELKMPPKSTYIEPKPLSGLTIFELFEE